ncbi:CpaF family protein [Candidatus Micrarchaeota archaeon]|nr:CpaF family protein [Candidatus Micrarchaeota archaeon]
MPATVSKGFPFSMYDVQPEALSGSDVAVFNDVVALVERRLLLPSFCQTHAFDVNGWQEFMNSLDVLEFGLPLQRKKSEALLSALSMLLSGAKNPAAIARAVLRRFYGYQVIQPLFDDDELEEVFINGTETPVMVYHRKAGVCNTNLRFDEKSLDALLSQFGSKNVYDDVRLVDGSRANVIKSPAAPFPAVTVRLFHQRPFSLLGLIKENTISSEVAAFLWVAFEGLRLYPLNVLIVGSAAAGKTTTLNALSSLIPPNERIISIEDTPELNLVGRQNWVPLISGTHTTAQELLTNSLRMRPDRLILGEIRSSEAETLFTAMNTGLRGASGTFHSNNARDAITRLENNPMNVPRSLLPLADLIVVQQRFYDRRRGLVRRVVQVTEVFPGENGPAINEVYAWNSENDSIERTPNPAGTIEKLANGTGKRPKDIMDEVSSRKKMLDYLLEQGLSDHAQFAAFLDEYYKKSA